jgi:hypothetical protein
MLSLVGNYDTAILVSGDEDFAYAINVVAYKGVRVEVAGFRGNTSPRLIDVADRFIDFDGVIGEICKAESRYASYSAGHPRPAGSRYGTPQSAVPPVPAIQPVQPVPSAPPAAPVEPVPPLPVETTVQPVPPEPQLTRVADDSSDV